MTGDERNDAELELADNRIRVIYEIDDGCGNLEPVFGLTLNGRYRELTKDLLGICKHHIADEHIELMRSITPWTINQP